jgi:superoxide reductase
MAEKNGIYKCLICGNVIEVIEPHEGTLACCGHEMQFMAEQKKDTGMEKHAPIIKKENGKIIIEIGSIPHPMEEAHYIELVQLFNGEKEIASKRPQPGEKPRAEFCVNAENPRARALCNIHGLWTS